MAQLTFLGAAGTVTGSRHLVETPQARLLIDCGLFQGMKELRLRNWEPVPRELTTLDAILLTHAHLDHTGYLPRLVKAGYRGPIFATEPTIELLGLLLPDAAYLQEEEAAYANKHGYSKHKPALPLFDIEDALKTLRLLQPLPYEQRKRLPGGLTATLRDTGHLLGSASIQLDVSGRRLLFSGDVGRYNDGLLNDPVTVPAADLVVCESTYGDSLHSGDPLEDLAAAIDSTQQRGGTLLIPAFALGRTQDLLYTLTRLHRARRLPSWPIYVDSPMAIDATEIFMRYSDLHRLKPGLDNGDWLRPPRLHFTRTQTESRRLNEIERDAIIISASGMATGGRVLHHLRRLLPDRRQTILFCGYQAVGTRGRALLDGAEHLRMFGEQVPVRAEIRQSRAFSAHGDQRDLLRWLGGISKPPTATYLVHGEPSVIEQWAEVIHERLGWWAEPAVDGATIDLDQLRRSRGRRQGAQRPGRRAATEPQREQ